MIPGSDFSQLEITVRSDPLLKF